jgi:hypothetical protein
MGITIDPTRLAKAVVRPGDKSAIIKKLTSAYAEWEESANRVESELNTLDDVERFLDALGDSITFNSSGIDIFDRGKGYQAYLQGMALWKVRPLPGSKDKPMDLRHPDGTRMAWSEWLKKLRHPMSESSAFWRRRIYQTFNPRESKTTGFTEMLRQLAPSFEKSLDRDRAKWVKQNEFDAPPDLPPPPAKNETAMVMCVEATLNKIEGTLEHLKTVKDAPDLCKDVDESIRILSDQQKRIDCLRIALDEVERTLHEAYEKAVKYRDDGVRTAQRKATQVRASKQSEEGK